MQGATGPTGIAGVYGPQGVGWLGPTGPTGPTGISRPGYDTVTGPAGPTGSQGAPIPLTGGIYSISTYATGVTGVATPTIANPTPTTVWSNAIPAGAKGKSGLLSVYFDMKLNYISTTTAFDYGLYIDDVAVALGPSPTQRYVQNVANSNLIALNGVSLGSTGLTSLDPISLPVTISPSATNLQIKLANTSAFIQALNVSNVVTALTTTGSNAYTTPVGSVGVLAYVWGCGGSPFGSNAGGPGGFSFGYYPCVAGTVMTGIVGALGTGAFVSGFGGTGYLGAGNPGSGGGFSGLFLGNNPLSNSSTPLVVAGGGGGCYVNNTGSNYMWVGGGGGGLQGTNSFNLSTQAYSVSYGNAGTQTGAGNGGAQWNGAAYFGISNGAGGGGYYGGGGNGPNTWYGGGGGSGFINAAVSNAYIPAGITATSQMTPGGGSNVTANGRDIMSNFGYSPNTYAHGGGGTGLILLIAVLGSNAPFIGVDARFSST